MYYTVYTIHILYTYLTLLTSYLENNCNTSTSRMHLKLNYYYRISIEPNRLKNTYTTFAMTVGGFTTRSLMFYGRSKPWSIREIEFNRLSCHRKKSFF